MHRNFFGEILIYFVDWSKNLSGYVSWWQRVRNGNEVMQNEFIDSIRQHQVSMLKYLERLIELRKIREPWVSTFREELDHLVVEVHFVADAYKRAYKSVTNDISRFPLAIDQLQTYATVIINTLKKIINIINQMHD